MGVLFQLILAAMIVSLFVVSRPTKLALVVIVLVCLQEVQIAKIPLHGVTLFMGCLFLSELPNVVDNFHYLRRSRLMWIILLVMLSTAIAYFHSPHYVDNPKQTLLLVFKEWICKYFIFCYGFLCIVREKDFKRMTNALLVAVVILFLFGLINYITKSATFLDIIGKDVVSTKDTVDGAMYDPNSGRYRVQAMFVFPFDYGFVCVMTLALGIWGYLKGCIKQIPFFILVIMSLFGVYACGCRTVVFVLLIGGLVFMISYLKIQRTIVYAIGVLMIIVLFYIISPAMQDFLDKTLSVFDPNSSKVEGSSMVMRGRQYAAALWHIKKDLLFGKGIDFFLIDMRWGEGGMEKLVDKDLLGLEGVLMNLLLERGFVGVFFYLAFMISIGYYFIKNMKVDRETASIGLGVLIAYLTYANLTGELLSYYSSFFLMGCFMGFIFISKQNDFANHDDEDAETEECEPPVFLKLVPTFQEK